MYGGTCVNIGCLPTKSLVHSSNSINELELLGIERDEEFNEIYYKNSLSRKKTVISKLNNKNFNLLNDNENVDIFTGEAKFVSNYTISVNDENITSKNIIINTGSTLLVK